MPYDYLLIDADVLCYQAVSVNEKEIDWGDGTWTMHTNMEACRTHLVNAVDTLLDEAGCAEPIMAFSDSENFRKTILPTYKDNRKKTRKPMGYKDLEAFAQDRWQSYTRPTLEGDDILGILATHPKILSGSKVIWSIDKDLKQIPGHHYLMDEVTEITPEEGYLFHMMQTLTGDRTDGYDGCPGVGPKKAEKALEGLPQDDWWPAVVETYEKSGLNEAEALIQAQVACICQAHHYDFKKKEVRPWQP
jgi:DNA polymerase-1